MHSELMCSHCKCNNTQVNVMSLRWLIDTFTRIQLYDPAINTRHIIFMFVFAIALPPGSAELEKSGKHRSRLNRCGDRRLPV